MTTLVKFKRPVPNSELHQIDLRRRFSAQRAADLWPKDITLREIAERAIKTEYFTRILDTLLHNPGYIANQDEVAREVREFLKQVPQKGWRFSP